MEMDDDMPCMDGMMESMMEDMAEGQPMKKKKPMGYMQYGDMDMDDEPDDDVGGMGEACPPGYMGHMGPMCHMEDMHYMHNMGYMPSHMPMGKMPMGKKPCHLLAHAYVPWQRYCRAFCPAEALEKGTLFPELYGVYPIPR